jgi:hypothetical protein
MRRRNLHHPVPHHSPFRAEYFLYLLDPGPGAGIGVIAFEHLARLQSYKIPERTLISQGLLLRVLKFLFVEISELCRVQKAENGAQSTIFISSSENSFPHKNPMPPHGRAGGPFSPHMNATC